MRRDPPSDPFGRITLDLAAENMRRNALLGGFSLSQLERWMERMALPAGSTERLKRLERFLPPPTRPSLFTRIVRSIAMSPELLSAAWGTLLAGAWGTLLLIVSI